MAHSTTPPPELIAALEAARNRFLALVQEVRPDLHRYCARMTGSVADGEDVVQDTLARAYYELAQMKEMPPLKPWLFRIAHNRAVDHLRSAAYRSVEPLEAVLEVADDASAQPEEALARTQAVSAAVGGFLRLAPVPRACVILKDVLDHSLEEIAAQLSLSLPAVKSALHRGRAALRESGPDPAPAKARAISPQLVRYAELFNAHDWDGMRALLADDVKLDLVSRRRIEGEAVGSYFSNYESMPGWRVAPAWLDDGEVLAVFDAADAASPRYFVILQWTGQRVQSIRDFRYVPYIANEAGLVIA